MSVRKNRDRWQALIDWGRDPVTGARRRRSAMADTKREAERLERQMLRELDETWGKGTGGAKVGAYLRDWLEVVKRTRSTGTYRAWESVIRTRVLPSPFAKLKLSAVTPDDGQQLVFAWSDLGIAGRTQRKYYECVHASFAAAVESGKLTRNPLDKVSPPRFERRVPTVWSAEQLRAFLAACWADTSRYADVLLLLAYTGCRMDEIVHADERQVDRERGLLLVLAGKTRAARRPVHLPAEALRVLDRARARHAREEPDWLDDARFGGRWLVRGPRGRAVSPRGVLGHFHELRQRVGLPYSRPHDLRHFMATAGLLSGLDVKRVGALLGHSSAAVTSEVYQHVVVGTLQADAERVLAALRDTPAGAVCPTCGGTGRVSRTAEVGDA